MEYLAWILILLLAVGTFVAAYFSSRTWHWANVTLVVLVFLSGLLYIVLAAKVVQIRAVEGKRINNATSELEDYRARRDALLRGTRDTSLASRLRADGVNLPENGQQIDGIRDLDHRLHLRTRIRGRVWRNAAPAAPMDPETGTIPVAVESPVPHGIDANTVMFVFQQGDPAEGAAYLGEFRVTEAGEGGVQLQPVVDMDQVHRERLARSPGPWLLYETMPVDQHELFADLSEEQLRQMLPPESVEEYVRHGSEATQDDDQWHRAAIDETGKPLGPEDAENTQNVRYRYDRPLRDYVFLFPELARQYVVLVANIAAAEKDIERLQQAIQGAQQLQAFRRQELQKLEVDLAGTSRDRQAIEEHLARLERQIEVGRQLLQKTLRDNRQQAQQLSNLQLAAGRTSLYAARPSKPDTNRQAGPRQPQGRIAFGAAQ